MGSERPPIRLVPLAFVLVLCGLIFFRGRTGTRAAYHALEGKAFGTTWSVQIPQPVDGLQAKIEARLAEIDALMSTWRDDSELVKFNVSEETAPAKLALETYGVISLALAVSKDSGGAFDPTVGPLVRLWGFARDKRKRPPTDEELAAARSDVGYAMLTLSTEGVAKARPGLRVDLSAIAKGHAVDQLARLIEAAGVTDYWVEIGGEIRVRGKNARRGPWRVGIESPTAPGSPGRVLELSSGSVATSGDYRNFREVDGKRQSHIIDPRTGRPVTHRVTSCSVYHAQCALADAWATAMMVLGPDEGMAVAKKLELAVLLQVRAADGTTTVSTSPAWDTVGP